MIIEKMFIEKNSAISDILKLLNLSSKKDSVVLESTILTGYLHVDVFGIYGNKKVKHGGGQFY